jgi:hypothetical protein
MPISEADGCVVPKSAWNRMLQDFDAETILVRVSSHADDKEWILHVHSYHTLDDNVLFLPQRYYDELHHQPSDVDVELLHDTPATATKIVLQPVDSSSEGIDVASAVSEYLSSWHVLSAGTMLHVPIQELGGFIVDIAVQEVEPVTANGYVLLRGEVPLELAEPLIQPERPQRVGTPMPQPLEKDDTPADWSSILPQQESNPVVQTKPASNKTSIRPAPKQAQPKGYVPFGGVGHRLCDS